MASPALLFAWWLAAATSVAPADVPAPIADLGLTETVEVSASHGRLGTSPPSPASASALVVDGDALRASGARSGAEALARLPGVQAVDQVGNGRQLSIDLRGFSGADGMTALVVDGVRMNDADTNFAAWEMLRLEEIERVEVAPGPRGAFVGGGAVAGVVRVTRRRPAAEREGEVTVRAGRFGFRDVTAVASGPVGPWRLLGSAGAFEDDGFRDDAGSRERALRAAAERDIGSFRLALDASRMEGRWRQPGALDADDLAADSTISASNALDFQESRQGLLTTSLQRDEGRTRVALVLAFRDRSSDLLTTGRSCFGYRTRDSQQSLSLTAEADTELLRRGATRLGLRWGTELARERLHPQGYATDDTCDGEIHAEAASSATDLDWDRGALFAGLDATLRGGWGLELSARHDRSDVSRRGHEMSALGTWDAVDGHRSFSATTLRVATGRSVTTAGLEVAWNAAWEQSFLAPSAIQLFAYPGFFSNPDLEAQQGIGPVAGLSLRRQAWDARLEVFETRVEREITYDDATLQNVNAGTTRRRGAELRLELRPRRGVRVSLGHLFVDATYRGGFPAGTHVVKGARVPLVARHATDVALDVGPFRGWSARLSLRRTGDAPLSNDFDGSMAPLPGRRLVAASLTKELPRPGLTLELSGENLLDDRHPGRGIESWGVAYYTPPVPRTITLGLAWHF